MMKIRKPAAAGMFYPSEADSLTTDIQAYLNSISLLDDWNPAGFIAPHAGYIYSGPIASYAYRHLTGLSFDKVVIVAPSHFDSFDGLSIYSGEVLETPIGQVDISVEDRDRWVEIDGIFSSELGFRQEHSLEVQLPFLQHVLKPGWQVLPIMMGYQNREVIDLAEEILKTYFNQRSLVIISSDLSHYHPYNEAREIDLRFCKLVEENDLDGLWNAYDNRQVEACGFGPIYAFLSAISGRENISVKLLDYRNSGDTAGFKNQVVGYCAIGAFWQD